ARVGVFGHSFGGATAAEACRLDRRCKAGADLDGTPYGPVARAGLPQPFLFVRGDEEWDSEERPAMDAIVQSAPTDHGAIMIRGARHFNFADTAVTFAPMARPLGCAGPAAAPRWGLGLGASSGRSPPAGRSGRRSLASCLCASRKRPGTASRPGRRGPLRLGSGRGVDVVDVARDRGGDLRAGPAVLD